MVYDFDGYMYCNTFTCKEQLFIWVIKLYIIAAQSVSGLSISHNNV